MELGQSNRGALFLDEFGTQLQETIILALILLRDVPEVGFIRQQGQHIGNGILIHLARAIFLDLCKDLFDEDFIDPLKDRIFVKMIPFQEIFDLLLFQLIDAFYKLQADRPHYELVNGAEVKTVHLV